MAAQQVRRIKVPPKGEPTELALKTGASYRVVLAYPRVYALVVPDENFRHDRCVWLPEHEDPTPGEDNEPHDSARPELSPGLELAVATWKQAMDYPERQLLVAGHTDASGDSAYNRDLSEHRAEQVRLYLTGAHDEWGAHASEHGEVDDLQAVLHWISASFEFDCDPGKIDNLWGPNTEAGLAAFRAWYARRLNREAPSDPKATPQDWAAVSESYDRALMRSLGIDKSQLASARAALQWRFGDKVLACGESWPSRAPETGSAAENRRVEVLFAEPEDLPDALFAGSEGAALYDNPRYRWEWLKADQLPLPKGAVIRNDVHLLLLSNSGRHALADCALTLHTPRGPREARSDAEGQFKVLNVTPGYHELTVQYAGETFKTRVPTSSAGTGPFYHRVSGARLAQGGSPS